MNAKEKNVTVVELLNEYDRKTPDQHDVEKLAAVAQEIYVDLYGWLRNNLPNYRKPSEWIFGPLEVYMSDHPMAYSYHAIRNSRVCNQQSQYHFPQPKAAHIGIFSQDSIIEQLTGAINQRLKTTDYEVCPITIKARLGEIRGGEYDTPAFYFGDDPPSKWHWRFNRKSPIRDVTMLTLKRKG
ncbi:hypothetical protein FWF89_00805 [Candidatus Saccharibacteria bacterium]|nr:hypothetical protein [Candidatus Saccharibacteria bacterium]